MENYKAGKKALLLSCVTGVDLVAYVHTGSIFLLIIAFILALFVGGYIGRAIFYPF